MPFPTKILKCFSGLNIDITYDRDVIKEKYKKLALIYHPDKKNGDVTKFIEIKEKYEQIMTYLEKGGEETLIDDELLSICKQHEKLKKKRRKIEIHERIRQDKIRLKKIVKQKIKEPKDLVIKLQKGISSFSFNSYVFDKMHKIIKKIKRIINISDHKIFGNILILDEYGDIFIGEGGEIIGDLTIQFID